MRILPEVGAAGFTDRERVAIFQAVIAYTTDLREPEPLGGWAFPTRTRSLCLVANGSRLPRSRIDSRPSSNNPRKCFSRRRRNGAPDAVRRDNGLNAPQPRSPRTWCYSEHDWLL